MSSMTLIKSVCSSCSSGDNSNSDRQAVMGLPSMTQDPLVPSSRPKVVYITDIDYSRPTDAEPFYKVYESPSAISTIDLCADGCCHALDLQRLAMTFSLMLNLGLESHVSVQRSSPCTLHDLRAIMTPQYLAILQRISRGEGWSLSFDEQAEYNFNVNVKVGQPSIGSSPASSPADQGNGCSSDSVESMERAPAKCSFLGDCPAFERVLEYCEAVAGDSLLGADLLANKETDCVVALSGGWHHGKRTNAAGFCFLNDINLAIVRLLNTFERVLYIDIDFHHGDGVEEAFYFEDRVLTLSLHKAGAFPGTGNVIDDGFGRGKGHSVNVPLWGGVSETDYLQIFEAALKHTVSRFKPDVVVLQAGVDSLGADPLTGGHCEGINLSSRGHMDAVKKVRNLGIPMLMLGGGGYSANAAARAWAAEVACLAGLGDISDSFVPENDQFYIKYLKKKNEKPSMLVPARKGGDIANQYALHQILSRFQMTAPSNEDGTASFTDTPIPSKSSKSKKRPLEEQTDPLIKKTKTSTVTTRAARKRSAEETVVDSILTKRPCTLPNSS